MSKEDLDVLGQALGAIVVPVGAFVKVHPPNDNDTVAVIPLWLAQKVITLQHRAWEA
jgi:hypothetical protein